VQGDSGNMVYCTHLEIGRRVVGDTRWETPLWCPLLAAAVSSLLGSAVPLNADPPTVFTDEMRAVKLQELETEIQALRAAMNRSPVEAIDAAIDARNAPAEIKCKCVELDGDLVCLECGEKWEWLESV
jgi:hypothetical protein